VKHAVWSEFLPWQCVEADLPRLKQYNLQLNLAIPARSFPNHKLAKLLKSAQQQGVPIGAWLLLSDKDGYWPNAENARLFYLHVISFIDWLDKNKLQVTELIVDMETPLALSRLMKGRLIQGLQLEWQRWLSQKNHEQFLSAQEIFHKLVKTVHQANLKIEVVTYPFIVHDARANNTAFQEFLQIPVTSIPWDSISLMVYRSSFQDFWPLPLSSWMVYQYITNARKYLNQPIKAALGVVGSIGKLNESGFNNPDEIRRDLAAAKAAGAQGLELFSLDGMHQLGAPLNWLPLFSSPAAIPRARPADLLLFQSLNHSHKILSGLYKHFWAQSKNEKLPSRPHDLLQNAPSPQKGCEGHDASRY